MPLEGAPEAGGACFLGAFQQHEKAPKEPGLPPPSPLFSKGKRRRRCTGVDYSDNDVTTITSKLEMAFRTVGKTARTTTVPVPMPRICQQNQMAATYVAPDLPKQFLPKIAPDHIEVIHVCKPGHTKLKKRKPPISRNADGKQLTLCPK